MTEIQRDKKIHKVALLVALACVLQISESMLPHPVPGLRLGLANMLTLTALVLLGFRYAMEVAILRTILSSFLLGTFLSPGFILSFSGAVISTLIMGFFYWLSGLHQRCQLSIIGLSIVGALTHNLVQLYLAYFLLIKNSGIFIFLPWLMIGALATGWVVGVVTGGVCRKLTEVGPPPSALAFEADVKAVLMNPYTPGVSFIHRLKPEIKLAALMLLALAVLFHTNLWLYVGLGALLAAAAACARIPLVLCLKTARRYIFLIAVALLFPIFFNSGSTVWVEIGFLKITQEGLLTGSAFAIRILFLVFASLILVRTTSPREMTRAMALMLSPLEYLGISRQRTAAILSLSWEAVPFVWESARQTIIGANLKQIKNLRHLLPVLTDLIANLYVRIGSRRVPWENLTPPPPVEPAPRGRINW